MHGFKTVWTGEKLETKFVSLRKMDQNIFLVEVKSYRDSSSDCVQCVIRLVSTAHAQAAWWYPTVQETAKRKIGKTTSLSVRYYPSILYRPVLQQILSRYLFISIKWLFVCLSAIFSNTITYFCVKITQVFYHQGKTTNSISDFCVMVWLPKS